MRSNTKAHSLNEVLIHQHVRRMPVTHDPEVTGKWIFYALIVAAIVWTVWIVGNV